MVWVHLYKNAEKNAGRKYTKMLTAITSLEFEWFFSSFCQLFHFFQIFHNEHATFIIRKKCIKVIYYIDFKYLYRLFSRKKIKKKENRNKADDKQINGASASFWPLLGTATKYFKAILWFSNCKYMKYLPH